LQPAKFIPGIETPPESEICHLRTSFHPNIRWAYIARCRLVLQRPPYLTANSVPIQAEPVSECCKSCNIKWLCVMFAPSGLLQNPAKMTVSLVSERAAASAAKTAKQKSANYRLVICVICVICGLKPNLS